MKWPVAFGWVQLNVQNSSPFAAKSRFPEWYPVVRITDYDTVTHHHGPWHQIGSDVSLRGRVRVVAGKFVWASMDDGTVAELSFTPADNVDPSQWEALQAASPQTSSTSHPAQKGEHPMPRDTYSPQGRRPSPPAHPAQRPGERPAQRPAQRAAQGWTMRPLRDGPHAFRGEADLGLLVNDNQVVKSTNGGRLWALFNLRPDGAVSFVGSYGSVPGAPPPPNAAQNGVPAQFYPPQQPAPQVVYQQPAPQVVYQQPASQVVYAQPGYDPSAYGYGAPAPQVVYAQPGYDPNAPYGGTPGIPGYDPVTGQPLTAAQAAYQGAAYGAQVAAQQLAADQQQAALNEQLAMSLGLGGGINTGCLGGMCGGFDPSTLMMLSGGDSDLALQMALSNGGYDPTAGGMLDPYGGF